MTAIDFDASVATLHEGSTTVIGDLEALKALGRPWRIKAGFDPTAPDLHLGHYALLKKLAALASLGHEILFLVGDFTASIGDPTGKNEMRKPMTPEAIQANAQTYTDQAFRVLNPSKTQILFNSTWCNNLGARDFIDLAATQTVARMLERDDFSKRFGGGIPISIHEFLYPLIQGYDSVAMKADIEFGGTDQTFNLLVGRDMQKHFKQPQQIVVTMPLLEGLDGVQKMSKSLGNIIAFEDSATDMFGKIMRLNDTIMWRYFQLLSNHSADAIAQLEADVAQGQNPRDAKLKLAEDIVAQFFDISIAQAEKDAFLTRFSQKTINPNEVPMLELKTSTPLMLGQALVQAKMAESTSSAMRLIKQGAVRIDGEKIQDTQHLLPLNQILLVQAGKLKIARLCLLPDPKN